MTDYERINPLIAGMLASEHCEKRIRLKGEA